MLKEISPEYSLEGLMLKLKRQYFGHLMGRTVSLEKTLMLGKIARVVIRLPKTLLRTLLKKAMNVKESKIIP